MKKKIKIFLDALMIFMLPFLMAEILTGGKFHEISGCVMMIFFVLHHALNFSWIKKIFKGDFSPYRAFLTAMNILLFASVVSVAASGIMMSAFVFPRANSGGIYFARKIHLASSFWSFIFMSVHAGLHARNFFNAVKKIGAAAKIFCAAIFVSGVISFFHQGVARYIFLQEEFMFVDFSIPRGIFFAEYFSMIFLFASAGFFSGRFFSRMNSCGKISAKRLTKFLAFFVPVFLCAIFFIMILK